MSHAPLIAHAATSTTHPHAYHELFENHVLPFWQQNPPRHRLSKKPYKSIWDRNTVLQEDSLTFQVQPSLTSGGAARGELQSPHTQCGSMCKSAVSSHTLCLPTQGAGG